METVVIDSALLQLGATDLLIEMKMRHERKDKLKSLYCSVCVENIYFLFTAKFSAAYLLLIYPGSHAIILLWRQVVLPFIIKKISLAGVR